MRPTQLLKLERIDIMMTSIDTTRMRSRGWLTVISLVGALVLLASELHAAPLLTITGPGDLGHVVDSDQAAAVSFTFTRSFVDVTITADLTGINAEGGVFLMSDIGPSAGIGDIVATADFSTIVFAGSSTVLFTGLSLGPGDYAVVVASDQGAPSSTVIWNGSTSPTVTAASGVIDGIDFFAGDTAAFPPSSDFDVVFDRSAHFAVSGSVPELSLPALSPWGQLLAGLFILASGLGGVSRGKRVKR
jgi:hypothetical protein